MDAVKTQNRVAEIRRTLTNDRSMTKKNPVHAAELDLERKVLENELRTMRGEPRQYTTMFF
jgi:hypothetical protein